MNPPPFFGPRPTYYNSPLLDELHFHFPAILYEPDMFRSVDDLFGYIQSQMRSRYDLFSVARQQYQPAPRAWRGGGGVAPAPVFPQPVVRQPPRPRQTDEVNITMETVDGGGIHLLNALLGMGRGNAGVERDLAQLTRAPAPAVDLLNLLNLNLLTPAGGAAAGAMEPVIVRPTAQQIEAGTSIEILDAEEEICAICQDSMHLGEEVRAMNACDHRFHRNCIDTWFQRNVRCPVCRHDVREPAPSEEEEDEEETSSVDLEGMD